MPEWAQSLLAISGAAVGAWAAVRIELQYLRRDLDELRARVALIERGDLPRRR